MRSFTKWFENHGSTISSLGVVPMVVPILFLLLGDVFSRGYLKPPPLLIDFLSLTQDKKYEEMLFFISTVGLAMVVFGEKARYNKTAREQKHLDDKD